MPLTATFGFNNISGQDSWSRYERVARELNWYQGMLSGTITVSTRKITVSNIAALVPGALIEGGDVIDVPANVAAGVLMAEVNWQTTTPTEQVKLVIRSGVAAAPVQTAGTRWQLPLRQFSGATGSMTNAMLVPVAPMPRKAYPLGGDGVGSPTLGMNNTGMTLSTITHRDPGWPYLIELTGRCRMTAHAGTGEGWFNVNGTIISIVPSSTLATGRGTHYTLSYHSRTPMTGPLEALFRVRPSGVTSAGLSIFGGDFSGHLIPA